MVLASAKRKVKCGSLYKGIICDPRSAPDLLDLVAQLLQLGDDALPLVALNLDAPVLDCASGSATLLERCGQFSQAVLVQRHIEYGRDALPSPACRLSADFHGWRLLCRLLRCG